MVDIVTRVNGVVNGFVWGPFGLALLFCTGLWLSIRTGFFQFRRMGYWLRHTIGAIFTNKDVTAHTSKEDMAISQFQSMCTALAGDRKSVVYGIQSVLKIQREVCHNGQDLYSR